MVKEIKQYLHNLLDKVEGLHSILITDRDGVPVFQVKNSEGPKMAMTPNFLSTFGLAVDQGSKLGLGKPTTLICMHSKYQIIQMNKLPLIVNFIASDNCNTGHILSLEQYIDPLLEELKNAVGEP